MKITGRFILIVLAALLSVFLWWVAGYNFDTRTPAVAFGCIVNITILILVYIALKDLRVGENVLIDFSKLKFDLKSD